MSFITSNTVKVIADNNLPAWLKVGDIVRITDTITEGEVTLYLVSNGTRTWWRYENEIALATADEIEAAKNDPNKLLNDFRAFQKEK